MKSEPKDVVSYADVYAGPAMTLASALATLESFGGSVATRADGTLSFQLPRRLAEDGIEARRTGWRRSPRSASSTRPAPSSTTASETIAPCPTSSPLPNGGVG